jgi:hypothetical protein
LAEPDPKCQRELEPPEKKAEATLEAAESMPAEEYASKSGLSVTEVIKGISDGLIEGQKLDDQWYVKMD